MKTLAEIKQTIDTILEENQKQQETFRKMAEESRTSAEEHRASALAASEACDVKQNHKELEQMRVSADAAEMYAKRLAKLKDEPLLTETEYNAAIKEIRLTTASASVNLKKRLLGAAAEVQKLRDEYVENCRLANTLLRRLHLDVYRDHSDNARLCVPSYHDNSGVLYAANALISVVHVNGSNVLRWTEDLKDVEDAGKVDANAE